MNTMKKFSIKVNGKTYEVEVEELGSAKSAYVPSAPQAAPAAPQAAPAQPSGSTSVKAPMPGTINAIKVKAGDTVSRGQVLAVLEAMKMENEIMADTDGTVASVAVAQGQSVNTGDVILTLK